jgi:beta-galactosidase
LIEIKNKQFLIDGQPKMIMCGEIHYFRLDPKDWQDRINKLKESGCNAVATYVPWLIHEYNEGEFDFHGAFRPEHDLTSFIDLCTENDLYFFVRPGPFIMAEMKNEGIPYWVYKKHPEIVPVGWDQRPATTPTLDYLAPGFLQEVRKWYRAVMNVIRPRLYQNGGKIIAVQLDNEVGMLSWVSNCPDLTDHVIDDFTQWLNHRYDHKTFQSRYPLNLLDHEKRYEAIRSPKEAYSAELMRDLGHYMRNRFTRYIAILRSYAEENGVKDIPFVVNIHGTGGGRGFTYPIGISQLYESYTQDSGFISGSDIYFGDLTVETFQDLYLINGFMDAVHNPDQPLTSVEFNCGDGNFGNNFSGRMDPSAADFKARMCVAQGNRLLNYYLFSGGYNYRFDEKRHDGNDRIAHTGERHGFAAPISPEGDYNYTFPRMSRSIQTIMGVGEKLASMKEEHDDVVFGFVPDYYMTEYRYPGSPLMTEIVQNLESRRAASAWESVARALLLIGYRFGSFDVQNKPFDPREIPVLILPSARYMDEGLQQKLVSYLSKGGRLFLYGEIPIYNMEAKPCTILADALGVKSLWEKTAGPSYHLSVYGDNWASDYPEITTYFAQTFDEGLGTPIFRIYGTDEVCGFETEVGEGKAIVLAAAYTCDLSLFKTIFERLGAKASLTHDCSYHGLFMTSTINEDQERFIHILNLDGFPKRFNVYENGQLLFDGQPIDLPTKEAVMLPLNMAFNGGAIVYSTAELVEINDNALTFRPLQEDDKIVLKTERPIIKSLDFEVRDQEGKKYLIPTRNFKLGDKLVVQFD